jgi:hypothetical protein
MRVKRRVGRLGRVFLAQAFGALDEVIPAAKALACPREQDHTNRGVEVCLLDALLQLAHETTRDPVTALGAVEGDAGYAVGDLVGEGLRARPRILCQRWESHRPV